MDLQCSDKYALLQSNQFNRIPEDSVNESVIWNNQYPIQICIPACLMNREFFMITCLYSAWLENLWIERIAFKPGDWNQI